MKKRRFAVRNFPMRGACISLSAASLLTWAFVRPFADEDREVAEITDAKYQIQPLQKAPEGSFDIQYLGVYGGKMSSYHGGGINNLGHTCGGFVEKDHGTDRPMAWLGGSAMTPLFGSDYSYVGFASSINDLDHVTGRAVREPLLTYAGFEWESGKIRWIKPPPGYRQSVANCINNHDDVAGYVFNTEGGDYTNWKARAFIERHGKLELLPLPTIAVSSRAYSVNNRGDVAGNIITKLGKTHACVWRNGVFDDLGVLPGGTVSTATSINDNGLVVGDSEIKAVKNSQVPEVHPAIWVDGSVRDLGLPQGYRYGKCAQVNAKGEVTGFFQLRSLALHDIDSFQGFSWTAGKGMRILDRDLWEGFGYHVSTPFAINDHGQILASGKHTNRPWEQIIPFYVLTP